MTSRQAGSLLVRSLWRAPRAFALSVFGIAVGISVLGFFLALSLGMQKRVLSRIFPTDRLEVVPPKTSVDQGAIGALGSLLGGTRQLGDDFIATLRAHPDVLAVFPRMKVAFPVRGWGGERIVGRPIYTDLPIDGIDPAAVSEATSPWAFKDYVSDQNPFCTEDKNCPSGWYCSWDINKCEPPVPVIVSPTILEFYNGSFARMYGLPKISGFLANQLRGMTATAELGKSFISRRESGKPRQRKLVLVGVSDRAQPFGLTVPLTADLLPCPQAKIPRVADVLSARYVLEVGGPVVRLVAGDVVNLCALRPGPQEGQRHGPMDLHPQRSTPRQAHRELQITLGVRMALQDASSLPAGGSGRRWLTADPAQIADAVVALGPGDHPPLLGG